MDSVSEGRVGESSASAAIKAAVSVGKLVKLEWKIGITTQSSRCVRQRSPFVTLLFHVADAHGSVKITSVELTVEEFKGFKRSLSDANHAIERL